MSSPALDDAPLSGFHKRLALYAAGGPFLDGYILSIVGVALVQIGPSLSTTPAQEGLLGAASLVGMLIGGLVFGFLTDRFGRQVMYTLDLAAIGVLSILQFFVTDVVQLILLRLLIGLFVAGDYPMASSLVTEFMPRRHRGPMLSGLVCMFFTGAVAAYVVGNALLSVGPDGWRWMLLSSVVPAALLLVLRLGTPESPRWLLSRGRRADAARVLRSVYGDTVTVDDLERPAADRTTARDLVRGGYLGRLTYVVVFYTCSNIPVFAIYAFGPRILDALGLGGAGANIGSAALSVLFLVGVLAALVVLNRTGRRPMVIWGSLLAGAMLLVMGAFPHAPGWIILLAFTGFSIFNGGPQVLTWVYPNELFPTSVRGTAVGLVTAITRVGSAVGVYLVPIALTSLGIGPTMILAAMILVVGFLASLRWAPETGGLALDDASAVPGSARDTSQRASASTEAVR